MFKWRVIEPWHEPDGVTFFAHAGNIFTIKDMLKTEPSSPLGRYVKQIQDWGFTARLGCGRSGQRGHNDFHLGRSATYCQG